MRNQTWLLLLLLVMCFQFPAALGQATEDSISVDKTFNFEGDGWTYDFPYPLLKDTSVAWSLQSDDAEKLIDFLVFDNPEDPFGSVIVEVHDVNNTSSSVAVPSTGVWYLHVRESRFHGNYTVHVTGYISQTGTPVPVTTTTTTTTTMTTTTTTTTTSTTITVPNTTTTTQDSLFYLVVGATVLLVAVILAAKYKTGFKGQVGPSVDIKEDGWTSILLRIESEFSKTPDNTLTSEHITGVIRALIDEGVLHIRHTQARNVIPALVSAGLLVEFENNSYGMADNYDDRKLRFLEQL